MKPLVKQTFGRADPLGQSLIGAMETRKQQIIGVVADTKHKFH